MPKKKVVKETVEPTEIVEEKPSVKVEEAEAKEEIKEVTAEVVMETHEQVGSTMAPFPIEETSTEIEEVQVTHGPPQFRITAPRVNYKREDAQVAGTVAALVPNMSLGESIKIKRVS